MIGFILFALCSLAFGIGLSILAYVCGNVFHISFPGSGHYGPIIIQCLVLGVVGALISLVFSRKIAVLTMGVNLIDRPRNLAEEFLVHEISLLAIQSRVAMPQVGIFYSAQMNAFATGPTKNRSLVAVSSALLEGMTAEEARAVLAHEMGHVRSGDMVWMTVINGISNSLVFFFSYVLSTMLMAMFGQKERDGSYTVIRTILEVIFQTVLGVFAMVFVMAFSRYREYKADAQAAQMVGPRDMINALRRLESNRYCEETLPNSMRAFGVFGKAGAFASHPSIEERIVALQEGSYAV